MDDQGLIERVDRQRRVSGPFTRVPPNDIDMFDAAWLKRIVGLGRIDFNAMLAEIRAGTMDLWKLPNTAQGVAVTYPEEGLLFIYYLHGKGLFGSLSPEDLLDAARAEGLSGVRAHVLAGGMRELLKRLGFRQTGISRNHVVMELRDAKG